VRRGAFAAPSIQKDEAYFARNFNLHGVVGGCVLVVLDRRCKTGLYSRLASRCVAHTQSLSGLPKIARGCGVQLIRSALRRRSRTSEPSIRHRRHRIDVKSEHASAETASKRNRAKRCLGRPDPSSSINLKHALACQNMKQTTVHTHTLFVSDVSSLQRSLTP
jgi:hypothetical protein